MGTNTVINTIVTNSNMTYNDITTTIKMPLSQITETGSSGSSNNYKITPSPCKMNNANIQNITLNTIMCKDPNCISTNDNTTCTQYETPLNECYNGQTLFPDINNSNLWGEYDIIDTYAASACTSRHDYFKKEQTQQPQRFFQRT